MRREVGLLFLSVSEREDNSILIVLSAEGPDGFSEIVIDTQTDKEGKRMRSRQVILISVLMVSLWVPLSFGAEAALSPKTPDAVSEEEVRQFIDTYVNRYKAMDIDLFMELFSRKCLENRVLPYADIRATYQRMFAGTNQFLYYPTIYSVQNRAQGAFVAGHYRMVQTLKQDNRMRIFQGNIQWDLVKEDGALKIRELNYGRARGND